MKIVEEFPRAVREIEHQWIPMPDGCRLAARIWLPEDAEQRPVPAILEYIPYRKRDGTRLRDEPMHRYFAGHGYAAVRIDLRGSGESDGLLRDEYTTQELDDGVAAIRWVATRTWCSGAVGMMGKSWGGFNSLQVAALQPPELKAVLTVCSTDDRYADDAHYMGGCLLNENLSWGSVLFTLNAQPPDPLLVGESWRETWLARLRADRLFPAVWLRHQRRDEYWRHGSVCEDFARIRCPVYAVGGWADGYTNAVPRLLAGLSCPRKGLVGPWAHVYPHEGVPGPAIGFLQEALRWWDLWLKGRATGVMDEPMYRVWMQASAPPAASFADRPGRWVAERAWPSPRIRPLRLALSPGRLLRGERADDGRPLVLHSAQTVGQEAGPWCGFGIEGEHPGDQAADDARSLCFDSEPLDEPLEFLGAPVLQLSLTSDSPLALIAARLCELHPDGRSERISYALFNLTHRDGHAEPEPLVPGVRYPLRIVLNDMAHAFPAGARIRLALSTSYWPMAWPSPEPVRLQLFPGGCALELPLRPPDPDDARLAPFDPPEAAAHSPHTVLAPGGFEQHVQRDPRTGESVLRIAMDQDEAGRPALSRHEPIDLESGHSFVEEFRIHDDDPLSARAEVRQETLTRRGDWSTRVRTRTALHSTRTDFVLAAELEAFEGEARVFERKWERRIPRDHV